MQREDVMTKRPCSSPPMTKGCAGCMWGVLQWPFECTRSASNEQSLDVILRNLSRNGSVENTSYE